MNPVERKRTIKTKRIISLILFLSAPQVLIMAQSAPPWLEVEWAGEYSQLEQEIYDIRTGFAKKTAGMEGKILDENFLVWDTDATPLDIQLRRTEALIKHLKSMPESGDLSALEQQVAEIRTKAKKSGLAKTAATYNLDLYMALRKVTRAAVLKGNPLLNFDDLLILGFRYTYQDHMCDQYYGWNAKNGGGIYILKDFRNSPKLVDVLQNSTVKNGRFKGKKLTGGAFLSPELDWDSKTIAFAWTTEQDKCYHLFSVNTDGSNLTQLTDGKAPYNHLAYVNTSQNDFDPCFLPNGRIAFISERRGGYLRCSDSRPCPTYTLHSMKPDGSDIIPLSYHETNEWHPSVNNDGMIVYTRWDYIDRDDCISHHLWTCFPDGRDPRAPHGNYPQPHNVFHEVNYRFPMNKTETIVDFNGRFMRPDGEWNIRAIPGSHKYLATAGGHHHHSFGNLIIIDTRIEDDGKMSQVTPITTNQSTWGDKEGPYGTAWPLSEAFYLCSYNSDLVLVDKFGNREVLYKASNLPGNVDRILDPIPLRPRKVPNIIPVLTNQGENRNPDSPKATIYINNVYVTDKAGELPKGLKIKWMRIVQVVPQLQAVMNKPVIGYASESMVRMPLGVVPVEKDGSVWCEAPVGKEILFQLLDENGMAVQSMRSGTYVHAGEQMSCTGCHESKWESPPVTSNPVALTRKVPAKIRPEVSSGAIPYNWHILAKPVLQQKCADCHKSRGKGPDMSYGSLRSYAFFWPFWSATPSKYGVFTNGELKASGSRSVPGRFGAMESGLYKGGYLSETHYGVKLTKDELRRITLWLDMNSNELGAYCDADKQRQGKVVWPANDVDPKNPLGVEDRPYSSVQPKTNPEKITALGGRPVSFYLLGKHQLFFTLLTDAAKAEIYNLAGMKIRSLRLVGDKAFWDTRNAQGQRVEPGVYFAVFKGGSGKAVHRIRIL